MVIHRSSSDRVALYGELILTGFDRQAEQLSERVVFARRGVAAFHGVRFRRRVCRPDARDVLARECGDRSDLDRTGGVEKSLAQIRERVVVQHSLHGSAGHLFVNHVAGVHLGSVRAELLGVTLALEHPGKSRNEPVSAYGGSRRRLKSDLTDIIYCSAIHS